VRLPLSMLLLGACATGSAPTIDPQDPQPDAPSTPGIDAPVQPPADAPPNPPTGGSLLITEVALAPAASELVEIANPTSQTVDLSTYYLSDSGKYFQLPAGAVAVDANDFIVKFPAGATLGPGQVITVALDTAANFQTAYGVAPSYAITAGTMQSVAANSTPTLTNAGELIVLFSWDGQTDLVRDVDLVLVGVPSVANGLIDKSGQSIDGPDADTTPTAYSADARTIGAQTATPAAGQSTKRIALEGTSELHSGGNGLAGDDETSENTAATWDSTYTAPTPGTLPIGLMP
jgi:hypothetical protein